jgi:glycine cleavage system H protein
MKYTKDHEWIKVDGEKAAIGITDYAQKALGEIVFFEPPEVGAKLETGDILSTIESVKAASDVYTPVAGTVVEINTELEENPGKINKAPYDSWIAVLQLNDFSQLEGLMDEAEYIKFCEEEQKG